MRPLFDRIIVKQHVAEDVKTASGIIVNTSNDKKKPSRGDVLKTGPDVLHVAVGDRVQMTDKWFQPFTHNGMEYIVVDEKDVIAVLEDGDA